MKSTKTTIGAIALIIFCLGAGIIILKYGNKSNDDTSSTQSVATTTQPATPTGSVTPATTGGDDSESDESGSNTPSTSATNGSTSVATSSYKDGTYTATGSYDSPAGTENVKVSVVLKGGIVTASTVTNEATDHTSSRYQNMFISGYAQYVNGKSIASLNVGKVSGSSLTPIGFNQAIAKIKTQATA